MSKKRTAQNLRQDKKVEEGKYERAKKAGDQVGMKRAQKAIEKINQEIMDLI